MVLPKSLFALFFVQMSLGMMLCLPFLQQVGKGFLRFNTALILLFMLLLAGFGLRGGAEPRLVWSAYGLLAFAGALILYQANLWGKSVEPSRILLGFSVAGCVALSGASFIACVPAGKSTFEVAYGIASLFASAATLGTVMLAMILGHWYLVRFNLSIEPFRLMTTLLLVALGLRALLSIGTLPLFVGGSTELGESAAVAFVYKHMVFLMPRYIVGILFPLIFAVMAHQTVKIHSKQSATGILYVTIVPIIIM